MFGYKGVDFLFDGKFNNEIFADLLTLTQLHTASLEDHAKHLTKRVDGLRNLISSAKASGAVKKLLPTAVTGLMIYQFLLFTLGFSTGFAMKPEPVEVVDDSELEKVEKR